MRQNDGEGGSSPGSALAKGLGWFAIGLGVAQLVAPRRVARFAGLPSGARACGTMRLFGAREIVTGLGLLQRGSSSPWLMARVGGDLLDLSMLGSSLVRARRSRSRRRVSGRLVTALAGVAAVTALDVLGYRKTTKERDGQKARREPFPLKASVTIDRTARDLYAFWRDVENLPRFMTQIATVEGLDRMRSRWTVKVAGAPVTWEATITDDRPGELIRWRSEGTLAGEVMAGGQVSFTPAPGGRGTEVHVVLETAGPNVHGALARWLRKLPQRWLAHELRLFKQLMELGELVKAQARFTDPSHHILEGTPGREIAKPLFSDQQGASS